MLSQNIWCSFLSVFMFLLHSLCSRFKEEGQDSSLPHSVWYNSSFLHQLKIQLCLEILHYFMEFQASFVILEHYQRNPERIRTTGCFTPGGCTWVWKNVLNLWIAIFNFSVSPPKNSYTYWLMLSAFVTIIFSWVKIFCVKLQLTVAFYSHLLNSWK